MALVQTTAVILMCQGKPFFFHRISFLTFNTTGLQTSVCQKTISKYAIAWLLVWFMMPEQEEMLQSGLFLLDSEVENDL